jgi:glycosyltransferase involved in cell wall biosynthesis
VKISIVTVCRNARATINDCILSVFMQEGVDIEYIVVDGASTDGTLQLLETQAAPISLLISETDNGIYDAMNKGLLRATGDAVGFLNADDVLASRDTIATIAQTFLSQRADVVFGDVEIYNTGGQLSRLYHGSVFHPNNLTSCAFPPHPGFYARTELLRQVGGFDTHFKIAADFELMMRVARCRNINWVYLPKAIVKMRAGGVSNRGLTSYLTISRELVAACQKNGIRPNKIAIHGRIVRKSYDIAAAWLRRARGTARSMHRRRSNY